MRELISKEDSAAIFAALSRLCDKFSVSEFCRRAGISRPTWYKYKKHQAIPLTRKPGEVRGWFRGLGSSYANAVRAKVNATAREKQVEQFQLMCALLAGQAQISERSCRRLMFELMEQLGIAGFDTELALSTARETRPLLAVAVDKSTVFQIHYDPGSGRNPTPSVVIADHRRDPAQLIASHALQPDLYVNVLSTLKNFRNNKSLRIKTAERFDSAVIAQLRTPPPPI